MSADVHIVYGQRIARYVFAKRGNHSEAHLQPHEVAAIAAIGYLDGLRDSGRDELLAALRAILKNTHNLAVPWIAQALAAVAAAERQS